MGCFDRKLLTAMGTFVTTTIRLTLTEDEAEIMVDALEADMEGYLESAKEPAATAIMPT